MKEFKKPDVTAPRFRPKAYNIFTKKFFNEFKKKYPKYAELKSSEVRKIIKSYNQLMFQTAIEKRDGVLFPENIGWLFIGTCDNAAKQNVDYGKSHKYGVTVTNKNWETDGKLAKIFFTSYALRHKMKNREFWSFIACREFKRTVAKTYPENWNMYIAVESKTKVRETYEKAFKKYIGRKLQEKGLETYNDFDL
jgi:hypothetical protein